VHIINNFNNSDNIEINKRGSKDFYEVYEVYDVGMFTLYIIIQRDRVFCVVSLYRVIEAPLIRVPSDLIR